MGNTRHCVSRYNFFGNFFAKRKWIEIVSRFVVHGDVDAYSNDSD